MAMMDEVAFMAATRFSHQVMVTVSSDRIDFKKSIPAGTIIELVGRVKHVGNTSMKISVEIYVGQMYAEGRDLAVHGEFTFVDIDKHKKSVYLMRREPSNRPTGCTRKNLELNPTEILSLYYCTLEILKDLYSHIIIQSHEGDMNVGRSTYSPGNESLMPNSIIYTHIA